MTQSEKLQAALDDLEGAKAAYEAAVVKASYARSEECESLNRLNRAQSTFDAVVKAIKDEAPHRTDWRRES